MTEQRKEEIIEFFYKYKDVSYVSLEVRFNLTQDELEYLIDQKYIQDNISYYSLTTEVYRELAEKKRLERSNGIFENQELKKEFFNLAESAYRIMDLLKNYGYTRAYQYLQEEEEPEVVGILLSAIERIDNGR